MIFSPLGVNCLKDAYSDGRLFKHPSAELLFKSESLVSILDLNRFVNISVNADAILRIGPFKISVYF